MMQMSKYFFCCERCFEIIGRKNTKAAKLWMDLCALSLNNETEYISVNTNSPEIRDLEILGFLTSTENESGIVIKMNKYIKTIDGEPFFCSIGGYHEQR